MEIFNKIILGVKFSPVKFFKELFLAYGVLWTVMEPCIALLGYSPKGIMHYLCYVIISIIYACCSIIPRSYVTFRLKNTNTKINLKFGDLFEEEGCIVISGNDFFDNEIGDVLSPRSIHGQLVKDVLGNNKNLFDDLVRTDLANANCIIEERAKGKNRRYEIGTTASFVFGNKKYFLFALAKTNKDTHKVKADIVDMIKGLKVLWPTVRARCNGAQINIPVIGSGMSGVGISTSQLIQIILVSLLDAIKTQEFGSEITIIIHQDSYEEVNLTSIKNQWE